MTKKKKEELTKEQKISKSILAKLKKWFTKEKREIDKIKVLKGSQIMWVKDKKKIKYWQKLAEGSARSSFKMGSLPVIKVLKVIYKNEKTNSD